MFFLSPFALSARPFSWVRFGLYMAGLAALTGGSLALERKAPVHAAAAIVADENPDARNAAPEGVPMGAPGGAPMGAPMGAKDVEIVRLCVPAEDLREDLRRFSIPWFLRRQGATANFESHGQTEIAFAVSYHGKAVGDYIERITALDPDRLRFEVAFVPKDMSALTELAGPIETILDPVSLMRIVMAEHVRSSAMGDGFDFNVLSETPGSYRSVLRKALVASASGQRQVGDDITCPNASHRANIRRAYREEAEKAGANAGKL